MDQAIEIVEYYLSERSDPDLEADEINDSFRAMQAGEVIRSVVRF